MTTNEETGKSCCEKTSSCCGDAPKTENENTRAPAQDDSAPCCGPRTEAVIDYNASGTHWKDGAVASGAGNVVRAKTQLEFADRVGEWKVRAGFGRMSYAVAPGIYAVGAPTPESPVVVSANYKLSFDALRRQMSGRDAWILVLDTKAVNVWCAAGKGTFGTDEIVRRVEAARLSEIVSHRVLVVPQLGAPGVSAHEVKKRSGFRVVYGPVLAADLGAFLDAGMKATPVMRRVTFGLHDRLAVSLIELTLGMKQFLAILAIIFLVSGIHRGGFSLHVMLSRGAVSAAILLATFVVGAVLTPALLPWLPGRAFSIKGAWSGALLFAALVAINYFHPVLFVNRLGGLAWLLLILPLTSYMALNFTGSSTYTSPSGVVKETKAAIPVQIGTAAAGLILLFAAKFI